MKKLIKNVIKVLLRKLGYVAYTRETGKVTGVSLEYDLRLLIGREDPVCFDIGANVLFGARHCFQAGLIGLCLIEQNFVPMYEGQSKNVGIEEFLNLYGYHLIDYYEKNHQNQTLAWVTALYARR